MRRSEAAEWFEIAAATAALSVESVGVIGLRLAGAANPNAASEAWLMLSEKVIALAELQARFFTGSLGRTPSGAAKATLKHYRRKVAANRRRLSRS